LRTGRPGDHTDAAVALCASAERAVTTMLHSSAAELPADASPVSMFLAGAKCFYTQFAVFFAKEYTA
jgi:hypothetical protein